MKIWVTGIAGFLGSHLADALKSEGHEVDGNDNLICGNQSNVGNMAFWHTDCRNQEVMTSILSQLKPDILVHCAATAHEGLSSFSPSFITKNIYEASVSTFSVAIAAGVKRIVFMSSMARYGNGFHKVEHENGIVGFDEKPPFKEYQTPTPVDPYGIAKVAAEDTLRVLCATHGVKYSILVPHNIIGTRQRYNDPFRNVASIMINRCLQNQPPIVYGDGLQTRCFSPIADCLPSIIKAVNGKADGEIINIGPDKNEITIRYLAEKICSLTKFNGDIIYMPDRPNEVKHAFCSSDKVRRLLDYKEVHSLDFCLGNMVEDIKRRGPKPFDYSFPIEIKEGCPETWLKRMM